MNHILHLSSVSSTVQATSSASEINSHSNIPFKLLPDLENLSLNYVANDFEYRF
jgi:hypothetical protein